MPKSHHLSKYFKFTKRFMGHHWEVFAGSVDGPSDDGSSTQDADRHKYVWDKLRLIKNQKGIGLGKKTDGALLISRLRQEIKSACQFNQLLIDCKFKSENISYERQVNVQYYHDQPFKEVRSIVLKQMLVQCKQNIKDDRYNKRTPYLERTSYRKSKKYGFATVYRYSDRVHANPSTFLLLYLTLNKPETLNPAKLENNNKYIGVEIECMIPGNQLLYRDNFFQKSHLLTHFTLEELPYINIKEDGSIKPEKNPNYMGIEYTLLCKQETYKEFLLKFCQYLTLMKARVNSSCGLHVHIDCRPVTARNHKIVYENLYSCLPLLQAMNPASRHNNKFCKINKSRKLNISKHYEARYAAINSNAYTKYNTIEVRLHTGTIAYMKIVNWVNLLLKIADYQPSFKKQMSKYALILKRLNLSDDMNKYIVNRVTKFSKEETEENYVEDYVEDTQNRNG